MDASLDPAELDRGLVAAILARGDEAAFRRLYRRHTPRLNQLVLRLLGGSTHDAEDVVQETWMRAVDGLAAFRWEARFETWLTGIGLNLCRSRLRRSHARREDPIDDADPPAANPPAPSGTRIDLERAIALLPDGYRAVLVLHDVEGWTHAEIAAALEVTEGTSKSQLHHARRHVRRTLAAQPTKEETR